MKNLLVAILISMLANPAYALPGTIEGANMKSLLEIESSGGTATGNLSTSSPCVSAISFSSGSSYGVLNVGMYAYDQTVPTNIGAAVTIAGLPGSCSSGQVQLSSNASGNATGDTVTFGGKPDDLTHTAKLWDETNGQQLLTSIANGQLGGSGSGSGIELLKNPGFENGGLANWTSSGATPVLVTSGSNLLFGHASATWQASASGQIFHLSTPAVIQGLSGGNCSASLYYTYAGSSGDYSLRVYDGTNVLNSAQLVNQPSANLPAQIVFPCGATPASTLDIQIVSNVSSPGLLVFDNLHLGSFVTFQVDTSQPETVTVITTSGCTPSANCSGSNYTPPATASDIEVEMAGGGGGGFNGGTGGTTTFGSFLTANGGNGGGSCNGGTGGTSTAGSPAIQVLALQGGAGSSCNSGIGSSNVGVSTGSGGSNPFGGAGAGQLGAAGISGSPNTGSGGGGGSQTGGSGGQSSGSGGAGGYIDALIYSPLSTTYSFAVGSGGSPGGNAGSGGSGVIIVREHYHSSATAFLPGVGGLSPGDILATAATSCPTGTVLADGTSYPTSKYSGLFAVVGYTYGGSGPNFSVPDYRGLFLRGLGANGSYTLQLGGAPTGSALGIYQQDMFGSHGHNVQGYHAAGGPTPQILTDTFNLSGSPDPQLVTSTGTTGVLPTGGSETRGANLSVNYCIRTVSASAAPILLIGKAPTLTVLTSGSGTYTTPPGVLFLKIKQAGGGGGGGGSGSVGTVGTATTFGSILTAGPGAAGGVGFGSTGVSGTCTIDVSVSGVSLSGTDGQPGSFVSAGGAGAGNNGGLGGFNILAGAGTPGAYQLNSSASSGGNAKANTGAGGGGGAWYNSGSSSGVTGSGGGSGCYLEATVSSPAATYSYTIGTGGTGGGATSGGSAGGNGGSGILIIEEHYQ